MMKKKKNKINSMQNKMIVEELLLNVNICKNVGEANKMA